MGDFMVMYLESSAAGSVSCFLAEDFFSAGAETGTATGIGVCMTICWWSPFLPGVLIVSLSPLTSYVTSLAPDFTTNLMSSWISDNFIGSVLIQGKDIISWETGK